MLELVHNPVVVLAFLSWLVTQSTKYLIGRLTGAGIRFTDPGGMPSSHAAVVGTVATVIGYRAGFDTDVFGLAIVVAAVVVHDAYRVRWAVGEQARRLNDLLQASNLSDKALVVVWRGHRIREVIVGLIIGILIGAFGDLGWPY